MIPVKKLFSVACMLATSAHAQTLNEDLKSRASDLSTDAEFGFSIDTDAGIVAVGARNALHNTIAQGAVYIFESTRVTQNLKLTAPNGQEGDNFGYSVSIHNGIVAAGATGAGPSFQGAAYLFDATTGTHLHTLLPSDPDAGDQFGYAIEIHNNIVAVGSYLDDDHGTESGSVYLFDAITGTQLQKITPTDGTTGDRFGVAIAMDDNTLVVGAHGVNYNGEFTGAAYVYDTTTFTQQHKLRASDGEYQDWFGRSVAVEGNTIAIGASGNDVRGMESGSAYIFDTTSGKQLRRIIPEDGRQDDRFGWSLDLDAGRLLVGAVSDTINGQFFAGSAYLYDTTNYQQSAKIIASDGSAGDDFGHSVAMNNNTIAIGARDESFNFPSAGAAYILNICRADLNNDTSLNFLDVSAFISAFTAQDPRADFFADGNYNFVDVSIFLNAFADYCP